MKFNVEKLEEWMKQYGRGAQVKLCRETNYSLGGIIKLRKTGAVPLEKNLKKLAQVIGCDPQDLIVFTTPRRRRKAA